MMTKKIALKLARQAVKAYNKVLTKDYLKKLTPLALLNNLHPLDRTFHAKQFKDVGLISENQSKEYIKT